MNTLSQYQEAALKTAMPTAFSYEYLVHGIVEEVGELFGQIAKSFRDEWDDARLHAELISEYGDVAWKVAVLLHWHDVTEIDDKHRSTVEALTNDDPLSDLLSGAADIYEEWSHHEKVGEGQRCIISAASRMWAYLEMHSFSVTKETFSFVLNFNESKLRDRQDRDVLKGAGDHR